MMTIPLSAWTYFTLPIQINAADSLINKMTPEASPITACYFSGVAQGLGGGARKTVAVTGGPVTVSTAGPRRLIKLRNYVTESVFLTEICAVSFFECILFHA